MPRPYKDIIPFGLRLQPELKAKIEKAARAAGRSMNSEMVLRLESSFESPSLPQVADADLLAELLRRHKAGRFLVEIKPVDAGE